MKITQAILTVAALGISLFSATSAYAALLSRLNGQAVYDSDLNVTWLTNANLAATNTFGVSGINLDGSMTWNTAQTWIAAMNATSYLGFNDWRLPVTGPVNGAFFNYSPSFIGSTDDGFNISAPGTVYAGSKASEMAYLFYNELGNKNYCDPTASTATTCVGPQAGWGLNNTGPFTNFQSTLYWSNTDYMGPNSSYAWTLLFTGYGGIQGDAPKDGNYDALVVRVGDVSAVPEPAAAWLLSSGLICLAGLVRKRKAA